MSRTRLRQLVAEGKLRVRDPRISAASVATWCAKNCPSIVPHSLRSSATLKDIAESAYSWKRAAKSLHMEVQDVQKLVSGGQLKLIDPFITDRAFEEFSRKHGSTINLGLVDVSTRKWMVREYGIEDDVEGTQLPRAQKHALIVRVCRCGRKIAGNVYFRHASTVSMPERQLQSRRLGLINRSKLPRWVTIQKLVILDPMMNGETSIYQVFTKTGNTCIRTN